jgi:uncharacterized membrane protein (UPF0127 family)
MGNSPSGETIVMRVFLAALLSLVLLSGCSPGNDQLRLATTRIVVDTRSGPVAFTVELATDDNSRQRGLMYRTKMAPNAGMLFEFGSEDYRSFWMKNTPLPLDLLFVKADGTISTISENAIPYSLDSIMSSEPVRAVLEINGGRARALGIEPGGKVHAKIFGNAP